MHKRRFQIPFHLLNLSYLPDTSEVVVQILEVFSGDFVLFETLKYI